MITHDPTSNKASISRFFSRLVNKEPTLTRSPSVDGWKSSFVIIVSLRGSGTSLEKEKFAGTSNCWQITFIIFDNATAKVCTSQPPGLYYWQNDRSRENKNSKFSSWVGAPLIISSIYHAVISIININKNFNQIDIILILVNILFTIIVIINKSENSN